MYPDGDPRISEIIAAAIAATQGTSAANEYASYVSGSLNQAMDTRTNVPAASTPPDNYATAQPMRTASSNVDGYCSTTTYSVASGSNTATSYSIASCSSVGTSSAIPASANIPAYSVASVGDAETAANTTNEATVNSDYDYFPSMPDALDKPETSLGSMMSCTPLPPGFQTSFGSMSLGDDSLKKLLLPIAKIDKSAPTLTKHERSKGDLLDSDDDDDDDDKEHEFTTGDWEKMRAAFGITDRDMPKEIGHYGAGTSNVDLARDISGMSTLSMVDFSLDRSPSSMMMRDITIGSVTSQPKESSVTSGSDSKGDHSNLSEREKLEKMLLDRGASLAFEEFGTEAKC